MSTNQTTVQKFSSDLRRDGWTLTLVMLAMHTNAAPVAVGWSGLIMFAPAAIAHAVAGLLWLLARWRHSVARVCEALLIVNAIIADLTAIIYLAGGFLTA